MRKYGNHTLSCAKCGKSFDIGDVSTHTKQKENRENISQKMTEINISLSSKNIFQNSKNEKIKSINTQQLEISKSHQTSPYKMDSHKIQKVQDLIDSGR